MAWTYWGVFLFAGLTSAQNADKPATMGAALLALPRAGLPVSFDQVEERSRRENGGSTDKVVVRSKVFRDGSGRIRLEEASYTQLIDPVAGSRVLLLLSQAQIAYRMPWPRSTEFQFAIGPVDSDMASSSREMTATTQDMGARWIEGIKFTGTRIVYSAKGEPQPTTSFVENWYSTEFHLIGLSLTSSPRETCVARIENLRREEPEASLFTIPPDYKILELSGLE